MPQDSESALAVQTMIDKYTEHKCNVTDEKSMHIKAELLFDIFSAVLVHWDILSTHNSLVQATYKKLVEADKYDYSRFVTVMFMNALFRRCAFCYRVIASTQTRCDLHLRLETSLSKRCNRNTRPSRSWLTVCQTLKPSQPWNRPAMIHDHSSSSKRRASLRSQPVVAQ